MYFTNNAIAPYKRKRRLDRRFRLHNDGIKDIGIQIKQKARELAGYFKQLPNSKKVVFVISQIGKIVGILLAKSAKGEALTAEDKILRDKLRKRIEDLKKFSEMRGFDASETINKKQEELNSIESKDTRFKLKLFVSLVSTFASLIGDWFVLRTPKAEQLARRDSAVKLWIDKAVRKYVRLALKDAGVQGMKKGQHVKARDPEYVESLRNGGGMSTGKKIALGAAAAGAVGAGILAKKKLGLGSKLIKSAIKSTPHSKTKTAKSLASKGQKVAGKRFGTDLTNSSMRVKGEGIRSSRKGIAGSIANTKGAKDFHKGGKLSNGKHPFSRKEGRQLANFTQNYKRVSNARKISPKYAQETYKRLFPRKSNAKVPQSFDNFMKNKNNTMQFK